MPQLTLAQAQTIITTALKHGTDQKMQPLAVVVLDERGVPKACAAQDGTSLRRFEIACGKAHGALSFGIGSRALAKRAAANPHFIAAVTHAVGGSLVPVPGRRADPIRREGHHRRSRNLRRQLRQRRGCCHRRHHRGRPERRPRRRLNPHLSRARERSPSEARRVRVNPDLRP